MLRPIAERGRTMSVGLHAVLTGFVASIVVLALAGCGDGRSPEAVCKTWLKEGQAINDRYGKSTASADDNPLPLMADLLGAPGRLADMMNKVASVAPKDIEPAFKKLADAFTEISEKMGKNAFNPLGAIVDSLTLGFRTKGAEEDVNAYLQEHCARK